MASIIVEIRAAEGGDDAKLLVIEQLRIYERFCKRRQLDFEALGMEPGFASFKVTGGLVEDEFTNESGGHRWQRIPPTEHRGRVHTSTITVAVMPEASDLNSKLDMNEVEISTARGSGPGGQARNKTESCVITTHRPTGITVRVDSERSQRQNRELALSLLRSKLRDLELVRATNERSDSRRRQVGSGQRGDKVRTIRTQDGIVTDHRLGRRMRFSDYERGMLDLLRNER